MRRLATSLVFATAFSFQAAAAATPLEQLALAEKAADTHSQIELLRRILEQEPSDTLLRERLVRLWLEIEDYDMAKAALDSWKDAPAAFQAEVNAGVLFHGEEDAAAAIAVLETYRTKDPANMAIIRQLAGYYGAAGENRKLVELLEKAPGVDADPELVLTRAGARRTLGDFEGALADFALIEAVDAESVKSARPAYERLRVALPGLREADARLAQDPSDFVALVTRAQLLASAGVPGHLVRTDAERAWKAAPESAAARLLYARAALSPQRARQDLSVDLSAKEPPPESVARLLQLDEALAADPRDASLLAARSFELNDKPAQYALALLDADAALGVDPVNASALVEKIYALVKLGRAPDAAAVMLVLEKTKPSPELLARAFLYLAEGEMAALRFEAALAFANRGLKARPSAALYQTRATILNRLGRLAESQADLASAKKFQKK
jgi:tetratricopeptide (TPR) repeat protein